MTKAEVGKLLLIIRGTYPKHFEKQSKGDVDIQMEIWNTLLGRYTYEEASAGLYQYLAQDTQGFPPSPGQVIDRIPRPNLNSLEPMEAWSMVKRALRSSGEINRAAANFEKLPKAVQIAVGSPNTLMSWALLDPAENDTVNQSNFLRTFASAVKREEEDAKTPDAVKALINNTVKQIEANNGRDCA